MVNPVGGPSAVAGNQPTPQQLQAQQDLDTASASMKKNDYAAALAAYEDAVKLDPALAPQLKSTISALKKQVQLDAFLNDAQKALQSNDYATALTDYQAAGKLDPELAKTLEPTIQQLKGQIDLDNANQAQQTNDLPGMIKWYKQAVEDDPSMNQQLQPYIAQLVSQNQFNQDQTAIFAQINQAYTVCYKNPLEGGGPQAAIQILQNVLNKYPETAQYYPNIYFIMSQFAFQGSNISQAQTFWNKLTPDQIKSIAESDPQTAAQMNQLHQQLFGNPLANWTQYVSNAIGKFLGTDPNWINSVFLNQFSQIMPDWMNQPREVWGNSMLKEYGRQRRSVENGLAQTKQAIQELDQKIAGTSGPEKEQLMAQKVQLQQEEKGMEDAHNAPNNTTQERSLGVGRKAVYSRKGERDVVTTTSDSSAAPDQTANPNEKFQTSGTVGPGYWGMGQTLAEAKHYLETLGEVNIQEVGGSGLYSRMSSVQGQTRFGDAEARVADMIYTSSHGFHAGLLGQARADLYAGDYQASISEGNTTIGGQTWNAQTGGLSNVNLGGTYQVLGAQADADANLTANTQGLSLGLGAGGFVGAANVSGQVGASTLGGAASLSLCGQAWAGAGAKIHGNFSFTESDIGFNVGLGLGPFYIQPMVNINLDAVGQDLSAIYGTGDHKFVNMVARTGELLSQSAATLGDAASRGSKQVLGAMTKGSDWLGAQADQNIAAGGVKTLEGVGEKIGQTALDAVEAYTMPELEAVKQEGRVISAVGSDFVKGEIGKGIGEAVVGTAKAIWNGVKDVATTAWHAVKSWFSWL